MKTKMNGKSHILTALLDFMGPGAPKFPRRRSQQRTYDTSILRRIGLATAAAATLVLSSCVESQVPLLTDAKPLLGQEFEVHLYENFVDKKATAFHASLYDWKDDQYVRASGLARDVRRLVIQPLAANDFLIQVNGDSEKLFDYWVGRRLVDGVFQIFPLNETDVDEATRTALCGEERQAGLCHIQSHDALVTLARATAAKPVRDTVFLGVILAK